MAKIKRKNYSNHIYKAYKLMNMLLEKHGKIRVIFQDWCNWSQAMGNDYRRRVITSDGKCKVAYKSHGYPKYSSYSPSCFYTYSETKSLKAIMKEMKKHDKQYHIPIEIHYGWFFTKRIKL